METHLLTERAELENRWQEHSGRWASLGRLRLGVEPLEEQLARQRHVTCGTDVRVGLHRPPVLSLFSAFRRPDLGLGWLAFSSCPSAWAHGWVTIDSSRRAAAYLAEHAAMEAEQKRLGLS